MHQNSRFSCVPFESALNPEVPISFANKELVAPNLIRRVVNGNRDRRYQESPWGTREMFTFFQFAYITRIGAGGAG